MHVVLLGGGGSVGTDLALAFGDRGVLFDVVEEDYFTRNGERCAVDGRTPEEICSLASTDRSLWVNLAGVGDAYRCEADIHSAVRLNVESAIMFARIAAAAGVPLLHISTWEVYGHAGTVLNEESPCAPESPYARTKYLGESCALRVGGILRGRIAALRIGPVVGPNMRPATAIRSFIAAAQRGEALRVANGGKQTRQFIDYRDLAAAVVAFSQADPWASNIYNIASPQGTSVLELANLVAAKYPGTVLKRSPLKRTEPPSAHLDTERAYRDVGWQAAIPVAESVDQVVAMMGYSSSRTPRISRRERQLEATVANKTSPTSTNMGTAV